MVNDLYKRFWAKDKTDAHYVWISRWSTVVLMVIGLIVSTYINSISGAWAFIMQAGAGLGLVLILRWYWWRINAWSEISATIAPFIITGFMMYYEVAFAPAIIITTLLTTLIWISVTLLTSPESEDVLVPFWQKVHLTKDRSYRIAGNQYGSTLKYLFGAWVSAIILAYSFLFLIGKLLLLEFELAAFLFVLVIISTYVLQYCMKKAGLISEKKQLKDTRL